MHIVFICAEFPYKQRATGGFGTYVDHLSIALTEGGHHVTVLFRNNISINTLDKKRTLIGLIPPFTKIFTILKHIRISYLQRIVTFIEYPLGFSLASAWWLLRFSKNKNINIIEGADFGAETFFTQILIKLGLLSFPVVIKLHTPSFVLRRFNDEPQTWFYRLLEALEHWCLKNAYLIYSPTVALSKLVNEEYGISSSAIVPYATKFIKVTRANTKNKSPLVLYVGKLQYKKGIFDLMSAVPRVLRRRPTTKFLFIGPDTLHKGQSCAQLLVQKSKQIGVNYAVHIKTEIPQTELSEYYKKASILVVPSHWDNFPNVILEAAAYKLPVITTWVGGIKEMIVNGRTGLLVSSQAPEEIAKKIIYLFQKVDIRKKLGRNLYSHIKSHFSYSKISAMTLSCYEQVKVESTRGEAAT